MAPDIGRAAGPPEAADAMPTERAISAHALARFPCGPIGGIDPATTTHAGSAHSHSRSIRAGP